MRDNETGFFKIGKSIDPRSRLKTLMKQDTLQPKPNDFTLVEAWWADEETEKHLHNRYFNQRRRGEWFEFGPEHRADLERFFDTHQPFSVTHKPGSIEQLLKEARREASQLRNDLQLANIKIRHFTDMESRRIELVPPPPKETIEENLTKFRQVMEETSLKKRKIG